MSNPDEDPKHSSLKIPCIVDVRSWERRDMSNIEEPYPRRRLTPLESDLILSLLENPKTLSDLRPLTNARDTSVLHSMKALESKKLIFRDAVKHSYSLTTIGRAYAVMLDRLLKASNVLDVMGDFWLDHDLSGIPLHLLSGIGNLQHAKVVRATSSNLDAVHQKYLSLLERSKSIHGVSPVFHPDFVGTIAKILGENGNIEFVLTKEVLDQTRKEIRLRDLARHAKVLILKRNLQVYLRDSSKVGLTVTENFLSLGLYKLDGAYDYSADVMCSNPQALEWGEQLFEYYRASAEKVRLSSLL